MINLKVKKVMTSLLAFLHYQKTNKSPETTKLIVGPAPFLVFSFYKCLVCVWGCVLFVYTISISTLCVSLEDFCLIACVCVCVISHQSTSNKISYLNKLDALYHKTRSKVVMVLRYQGLTCIDF